MADVTWAAFSDAIAAPSTDGAVSRTPDLVLSLIAF
jgi:hypothetical protein